MPDVEAFAEGVVCENASRLEISSQLHVPRTKALLSSSRGFIVLEALGEAALFRTLGHWNLLRRS